MAEIISIKGGINRRLPPWHNDLETRNQCVTLQNMRYKNDYIESILGTKKYYGTSIGTEPITAIMPYYNDQTGEFVLLIASGNSIYKRNPVTNELEVLASGLTPNSIYSSAIRHGVMYIASVHDGLKKYLGGNVIENVGGGLTTPGSFRQVLYMKEIDRLFGISSDAVYGQISWCDISAPETWDGANVDRIKLKDGERVEGAEILYGKLIVFCTYSVWIYYVSGNEENWRLEEAPTTVGCVAANTIKKVGNKIWFLGESPKYSIGIYEFDGSNSTLLTDDVTSILDGINPNRKSFACAEVHDDLYTLSFAEGFSIKNNVCIDLDIFSRKEDGTPAIYGPHTFGFYSSSVLDGRVNNKEFLMGGEDDGFVYVEGGETLKSVNGDDGELLKNIFLSRVHNDGEWGVMKQYSHAMAYFHPRGHFDIEFNIYLSTGRNPSRDAFFPSVTRSYAGDFNVYTRRLLGTPDLYQHISELGADARGTSIQIEMVNSTTGRRVAIDGYGYEISSINKVRKAQIYAA